MLQVIRANYGIHSLEQAPIIRQLVGRAEANGKAVVAWDLEQELLELARRHIDDTRTAEVLRDTGDRRLDLLRRYDAKERLAEIVLGCYYDEATARRADSSRAIRRPFIECLQTIFSVEGTATPVAPGDVIELEVPDIYGRAWARYLGAILGSGHGAVGGGRYFQLRMRGPWKRSAPLAYRNNGISSPSAGAGRVRT